MCVLGWGWGTGHNSAHNSGEHVFLLKLICFLRFLENFVKFWRVKIPRLVITPLEINSSLPFTKSTGHINLQNGAAQNKPFGSLENSVAVGTDSKSILSQAADAQG